MWNMAAKGEGKGEHAAVFLARMGTCVAWPTCRKGNELVINCFGRHLCSIANRQELEGEKTW